MCCICLLDSPASRFFAPYRLEKEYTRIRHKEAEDNEEIRRLKTENRLLIQRVDDLEKVGGMFQSPDEIPDER